MDPVKAGNQPQAYYYGSRLADEYDVVIHVTEVTATQLLPFVYQ